MDKIHIMSPDELETLPDGAVVWQETNLFEVKKGIDRIMPMVMYHGMLGNYQEYMYPDELRAADDIQLKFRYWNYKPTLETMAKTPWEIREEWQE